MLNDPPPERRKPHPLERDPQPMPPGGDPPQGGARPRQPVTLHIPSVRPTFTYALIAINVAIFLIRASSFQIDQQLLEWGANNPAAVVANGEVYRLFTSMFLHASIFTFRGGYVFANSLHLIFNMYALYVFGVQVERLFGHVRFALIYLLGGLGGAVLSAVLSDASVYSVGASGAVFAILGAEFVYLYQHRKLLGARGRAQMQSLALITVINLLYGGLTTAAGAAMRIDNWAHIGGLVGGLALAWGIGPLYIVRRHPEIPGALIGEDINPLKNRYWVLTIYGLALMGLLFAARFAA